MTNDTEVIDNGITLAVVKARGEGLQRNLNAEGAYTRSNTVWLLLEAIKLLQAKGAS